MKLVARCLPLLCAALAACGGPAASPTAQNACTITKVAEIPVTFPDGFIATTTVIDGKPATMLIDTGSENSVVTPQAIAYLHLPPDPHKSTRVHGIGGTIVTRNAMIASLRIGSMEMQDESTSVGSEESGIRALGLVGADWIDDYDVEFDLPHNRIALYDVSNCTGDYTYTPWPGRKSTVNAEIYNNHLIILPVSLDNHPLRAMLDSGANRTVLNQTHAESLGISLVPGPADRGTTARGIDGTIIASHTHRFGSLRIGGETVLNPILGVSPLNIDVADMQLGADWLRRNHVWISYANHRVTFQPEAPGR